MGFPATFSDLFLPKSFPFIISFLGFIRNVISAVLPMIGLGDFLFLVEETPPYPPPEPYSETAALIRELNLFPVVKFSELTKVDGEDICAVCLCEFEEEDEIQRLINCQHIFHRVCVDRWMDHDHKTCPVCRKNIIPEEMAEDFNNRLWVELAAVDATEMEYFSATQGGHF